MQRGVERIRSLAVQKMKPMVVTAKRYEADGGEGTGVEVVSVSHA